MTVGDIINMGIETLSLQTDLPCGPCKYADIVTDGKGSVRIIADVQTGNIAPGFCNLRVKDWYVEPDYQDCDNIIVRIQVWDEEANQDDEDNELN